MNKTFELLAQIQAQGLTVEFMEAMATDIRDQSDFVIEEGEALMGLLKQASQAVRAGTHTPDTPMLVLEFFLGVESIDHYMEDFLNGFTVPNRE